MVTERWTPVASYQGIYADAYHVSDGGHVCSVARTVAGRGGSTRTLKGKILSPRVRDNGVLAVNLWLGNAYRQVPVKLLVLEAFDRPRPRHYEPKCINGDEADCRLANLRWEPAGGLAFLRARLNR